MNQNQIIKSSYHLFAFLFLIILAFTLKINIYIKLGLIFIAIFHAYDVWWFFNNTKDAPI
jgi:TRAP-type mannitol/chloroaromatic compound transport system permease small subunit